MNILIVGSGGREHAVAWKLAQSRHRPTLFAAPGNAGTAQLSTNLPVKALDLDGMVAAARKHEIDLVFVAPDDPLAAGLVDRLTQAGIRAFGPTRAAARIESSKTWAKRLMQIYGIPTARAESFSDEPSALKYAESLPQGSVVVKADGLTAGKGVLVPPPGLSNAAAVRQIVSQYGPQILIEEKLSGPEFSVFAFISGETVSAEIAACDYKRVGDSDTGPNTGGMGAYSPPEFWTPSLARRVRAEVLLPTAMAMVSEGCPFKGVLYAGLMLTSSGPKIIEFNSRLGDPEAQVILPRLESDLVDTCNAVIDDMLASTPVKWGGDPRVGVVMASGGYPGTYSTGFDITGIEVVDDGSLVFHAGTKTDPDGRLLTNGGRVLMVVSSGRDIASARSLSYRNASKISFRGAQYRSDIAARAVAGMTGTN